MGSENCWEYTGCGREKQCPAYPHNGRDCYMVTGTWCRGEQQGSYGEKILKCRELCGFYGEMFGKTTQRVPSGMT